MEDLKTYLLRSIKEGWAIPHFNISDLATLRGIAKAAAQLKSPLMIGTSEGERNFVGLKTAVAMVEGTQDEFSVPLFLNADHSLSAETAIEAIKNGYHCVHADLSKLPFDDNVRGTRKVVQFAHETFRNLSIEGEVGYLVTDSSKVYDKMIAIPPESLTAPDQAKEFVRKTGVDRLAAAVGTLHGIAANKKQIDIDRLKSIREAIGEKITLVLHGGSGLDEVEFKKAIAAGANCIHINTELRVAYSSALREYLKNNPGETTPYKILEPVVDAIAKLAAEKIKIFGSINKI